MSTLKKLIAATLAVTTLTACAQTPIAPEATEDEKPKFALTIPPDVFPAKEHMVYEYLGLSYDLPDTLRNAVAEQSIIVDGALLVDEDAERLDFANIAFMFLDDTFTGELTHIAYDEDWKAQAYTPYKLGVYHADYLATTDIAQITKLDSNTFVGTEGSYHFYISTNTVDTPNDQALYDSVKADFDTLSASIEITQPEPLVSFFKFNVFARAKKDMEQFGDFEAKDVYGNTITQDAFKENDLTLINVMTTWCTACVTEIPALEQLNQDMDNVGVMVFVLDTYDVATGTEDGEKIQLTQHLCETTQATFPFVIPNETLMEGRLRGITSYPESFFVDSDGNLVGGTHIGAHDYDGWVSIVETVLSEVA